MDEKERKTSSPPKSFTERRLRRPSGGGQSGGDRLSSAVAPGPSLPPPPSPSDMKQFVLTQVVSPTEIWARPHFLDRTWKEFSQKINLTLSAQKHVGVENLMPEEIQVGRAVALEVGNGHHYRYFFSKEKCSRSSTVNFDLGPKYCKCFLVRRTG